MKRSLFERSIQTSGLTREFSLAENDAAQFLRESPEPDLLRNLNLETITMRWIQCGLCRRETPEQWRHFRDKLELPDRLEIDEAALDEPSLLLDLLFLLFLDRSVDPPALHLYSSMLRRRWIKPVELIAAIARSSDLASFRERRSRIRLWRRFILAIRYRLARFRIRQKNSAGSVQSKAANPGRQVSRNDKQPPKSSAGHRARGRRIGIVVPRFGQGFSGGMERLALEAASLLQKECDVHIFTTCATDYLTWKNVLPEGIEQMGELVVHRFRVDRPRNLTSYVAGETRLRNALVQNPASNLLEANSISIAGTSPAIPDCSNLQEQWMAEQGPVSPNLENAVRSAARNGEVDALFFFSLQYATTARLLRDLSMRLPCLLVPTAHPDWTLEVPMLQECLQKSWAWIVSTPEEESLLRRVLHSSKIQDDGLPPASGRVREPASLVGGGPPAYPGGLPIPVPNKSESGVRTGAGNQGRNADRPYALFVGRLDPSKGLDELLQFFLARHILQADDLDLVLVGNPAMAIPRHSSLIVTGYISDEELDRIYAGARLLINPSPYESLSIVLLEAWARGIATLSNGKSQVLEAQTARSAAGLCYTNLEQFMGGMEFLLQNPDMGLKGIEFVKENYSSEAIGQNYKRILTEVFQRQ